jgi:hypothetical protein
MLLSKMRLLNRHPWGTSNPTTLKGSKNFVARASYLSSYLL